MVTRQALLDEEVEVFAEKPRKSIHEFVGTLSMVGRNGHTIIIMDIFHQGKILSLQARQVFHQEVAIVQHVHASHLLL